MKSCFLYIAFILVLLTLAYAAPLNNENESDGDSWIERMPATTMLTVAQRYEDGTPLNTLFKEHIDSLTMDDIRKAVTQTAHETGLIHYQFAQQEIEAQVGETAQALKAISDKLTAAKDFLVEKAIVAGAYIADAAGQDALQVEKKIQQAKFDGIQQFNAHIGGWLGEAATTLKDAVLMGITKVLLFLATLDISGTGGAVVALMKKIDAAGKAIGELATEIPGKLEAKLREQQIHLPAAVSQSLKDVGKEVQEATKRANLETNLAKLIGTVAVPMFCKSARSMAYVIFDKQRLKDAYEQINPTPPSTTMKIAGWAQDKVAIGTAHLILFSDNYLPECVDIREADCKSVGAIFKQKVKPEGCAKKYKIDCENYDKKCPKDATPSYTAPKKWLKIDDSM